MTAIRTPGVPVIEDGVLLSTTPATGEEVGRFPVADAAEVAATVTRAREAAAWWAALGFAGRRARLLRWRASLANRIEELAELVHRETGKPGAEGIVESAGAVDHVAGGGRAARAGVRARRGGGTLVADAEAAPPGEPPAGGGGGVGPAC